MKRLIVAVFALSACAAPATPAVLTASPATFESVLGQARAGDTIKLAPGGYGDVAISGRRFAGPVTIGCVDPANPPSLRTLDLKGASNIVLTCARIDFTPDASTLSFSSAVQISGSEHITIRGVKLLGGQAVTGVPENAKEMDQTGNVLGRPSGRGMTITGSNDIVIEDGELARFHRGIVLAGSQKVTIRHNDLHDMRTTAIVGSNISDVLIEDNDIHDAHPWNWGHGDHADFIAFWSDARQSTPNARIQVINNRISQADGISVLGMWLQGSEAAPFTDATISGNTFHLANLQAIALWNTRGAKIENNVMARTGDDPKQSPGILLREGATGVAMSGNRVSQISDTSGGDNPQKGNAYSSERVKAPKK